MSAGSPGDLGFFQALRLSESFSSLGCLGRTVPYKLELDKCAQKHTLVNVLFSWAADVTHYASPLYLPLAHPHTVHTNTPRKKYSRPNVSHNKLSPCPEALVFLVDFVLELCSWK